MQSTTPTRLELQPGEISEIYPKGIGMVAPFDFALDQECWRWLPSDVSLYITRTPRIENTAVTINLAHEVSSEVAVGPAVGSLTAVHARSVAYACTSGSFVGGVTGEQQLQKIMIKAGAPAAVTTSGAAVEALRALGIQRVAIATPYNESLTQLLADYLSEAGFTVVSSGYLDMEDGIARIEYDAVKRLANVVDHPEAEAVFFSCTNLRTFDIIEELEAQLDKPILSANQVTMWAAMRQAGISAPGHNQRLFRQAN